MFNTYDSSSPLPPPVPKARSYFFVGPSLKAYVETQGEGALFFLDFSTAQDTRLAFDAYALIGLADAFLSMAEYAREYVKD